MRISRDYIKIYCKDPKMILSLVTFLDRDDFLDDIKIIRDKLTRDMDLDRKIKRLQKKYLIPPKFFDVIKRAILTGVIEEWQIPSYPTVVTAGDRKIDLQTDEIAIIVSAETTETALLESFREIVSKIYNEFRNFDKAKIYHKQPDIMTNILRDRKWYWLHKTGASYSKIHSVVSKKTPITVSGVEKAIKAYSKLLNASIHRK